MFLFVFLFCFVLFILFQHETLNVEYAAWWAYLDAFSNRKRKWCQARFFKRKPFNEQVGVSLLAYVVLNWLCTYARLVKYLWFSHVLSPPPSPSSIKKVPWNLWKEKKHSRTSSMVNLVELYTPSSSMANFSDSNVTSKSSDTMRSDSKNVKASFITVGLFSSEWRINRSQDLATGKSTLKLQQCN